MCVYYYIIHNYKHNFHYLGVMKFEGGVDENGLPRGVKCLNTALFTLLEN